MPEAFLSLERSVFFLAALFLRFKPARAIELIMDSGRFGGKDNKLCVAYSPDVGLAGFCAPVAACEVRQREEEDGAPIMEENKKAAQLKPSNLCPIIGFVSPF